jgi:outer membrane protein OmpA-like peptidoglycan-associated protein
MGQEHSAFDYDHGLFSDPTSGGPGAGKRPPTAAIPPPPGVVVGPFDAAAAWATIGTQPLPAEPRGGSWMGDGGGSISDPAPPPDIPKWYQHQSTGQPKNGAEATIYFGTDDAFLTSSDLEALDEFTERWGDLLQSGDYELDIIGYADERFTDEYNENLAALRAGTVFEDLTKRLPGGMPEGSSYRSMGEVPSSQHPDDLARNRRVEIRIRAREKIDFPLPEIDPPTPQPGWTPPADWSTEWEVLIEGGGNAGELISGDVASLKITNLKTGETERFIYTGVGIGASAAPVQVSGSSGPFRFNTSAPVPIRVFASVDNAHFNIGANAPPSVLDAFGLPNGLQGEVWMFTGPRAGGADVVFLNTSGLSSASPNAGVSGTMGPLW